MTGAGRAYLRCLGGSPLSVSCGLPHRQCRAGLRFAREPRLPEGRSFQLQPLACQAGRNGIADVYSNLHHMQHSQLPRYRIELSNSSYCYHHPVNNGAETRLDLDAKYITGLQHKAAA
jgi:hypothetical protein